MTYDRRKRDERPFTIIVGDPTSSTYNPGSGIGEQAYQRQFDAKHGRSPGPDNAEIKRRIDTAYINDWPTRNENE